MSLFSLDGLLGKKNLTDNDKVIKEKKNQTVKIPRTVQQSIPYLACYSNGVIETELNKYSKTYSFTDINFQDAEEADQYDVKEQWGKVLNLFTPEMDLQLSIFNRCIDESAVFNEILLKPKPDAYNKIRDEANDLIRNSMALGSNNLESEKYLTVSFHAQSIKEAMNQFNRIDQSIEKAFRPINESIEIHPVSIDKRLSILYDIYNPYNAMSFERKYVNTNVFSLDNLKKMGCTSKDIIGCPMLKFKKSHIELGDGKYAKVFYLTNFPSELTSDFLSDIAGQDCLALTSVHYKQLERKQINFKIKNKMTDINKDLMNLQVQASDKGYSASVISPDLQKAQLDGSELLDNMMSGDQMNFLVTIQVVLFAESLEKLTDYTSALQSIAARYICDVRVYKGQMENAFNSALPLAANQTNTERLMPTDSASILIPFSTHDISQKDGIFLGNNQVSRNIIRINQHVLPNMNKMFLGMSGSGKSMQAKWEIAMNMLQNDDDIYIIDPDNEYRQLAALFPDDSEVIDLKAGATTWINPLDLDLDDKGNSDAIASKCDFMYGFMSLVFGKEYVLSPVQKSILNKCVTSLYEPYIEHLNIRSKNENKKITFDYEAAPTLPELYDLLMANDTPEAIQMAAALEMYCTGPNSIFAHKTNINPKKRMIIYNIQGLSALKELGIYVCIENAWNRVLTNHKKKKTTDIYMDEFHLMIAIPSAIDRILEMYKRARKFGGSLAGITQNITDIFQSESALKILGNCSFVTLMNQFEYDREQLAGLYNLTDAEKKYITNASSGTGLIKVEKNIYPFENHIPKDSIFYKTMSTKADE